MNKIELQKQARTLIPLGWYYFEIKPVSSPLYRLHYGVNGASNEESLELDFSLLNTASDNHECPIKGKSFLRIVGENFEGKEYTKGPSVDCASGVQLPHRAMGDGKIYYEDYCNNEGELKESPSLEFRFDLKLRLSHLLNLYKISERMSIMEWYIVKLCLSDHGLTDYEYGLGLKYNYLPVKILGLNLSSCLR